MLSPVKIIDLSHEGGFKYREIPVDFLILKSKKVSISATIPRKFNIIEFGIKSFGTFIILDDSRDFM